MADSRVATTADHAGDVGPGRAPARVRVLLAVVVVALLVVLAARGSDGAVVDEVLAIPPAGTVSPELLGNGTPVFVVHTVGGSAGVEPTVDVIQAFTTEVEGPVTGLVGWCAAGQQFVAPHHGPLYDHRGRRLPAALRGRLPFREVTQDLTAWDDLVHRVAEGIAGRIAEDEPLRVGGIQRLQPWQDGQRPVLDPRVPPDACRLGAADSRVVDHGFLAGRLRTDRRGWQIADGWLVVAPDGTASWCDEEPVVSAAGAASCGAPRSDVAVGFAFDPSAVGSAPVVIGGPLGVRQADGVVQRVAVLPSSTWRGSSLQGVEVVEGEVQPDGARPAGAPWTAAVAVTSADTACATRWPAGDGVLRIPVAEGAVLASDAGTPHLVEVDAVTCRATAIRPA